MTKETKSGDYRLWLAESIENAVTHLSVGSRSQSVDPGMELIIAAIQRVSAETTQEGG